VVIRLRAGELVFQDVDLVLERPYGWSGGVMSGIELGPGTSLVLERCTWTVDPAAEAVIRLAPSLSGGGSNGGPASLRLVDSLIRGGGDLIRVTGTVGLDLRIGNSALALGGTLLHADGEPADRSSDPLRLELTATTARCLGGLLWLDSTAASPEPRRAEVRVRDTILATDQAAGPLLRVDAQAGAKPMTDRVQWEGRNTAYHRVETYRREQFREPGSVPVVFDRADWEVAVGDRDASAFHGTLKFSMPWNDGQGVRDQRRDDLRLATGESRFSGGADLSRIPEPPAAP
jgi:hypothetical protein